MNDNKELIEQLMKFAQILGFTEENARIISEELILSILEEAYSKLLDDSQLKLLAEAMKSNDTSAITSIIKYVDKLKLATEYKNATEKVVSDFLKDVIDKCPPELLDSLETKIKLIQLQFPASRANVQPTVQ